MTIAHALHQYLAPPPPTLGSERSRRSSKESLARDLVAISRTNRIYFGVCFAMVLAVLGGAAAFVVTHLDSIRTIQATFGVLGISITALTAQMASLWKQKVMADMLVVLARNVGPDELKPMLDSLLAKL